MANPALFTGQVICTLTKDPKVFTGKGKTAVTQMSCVMSTPWMKEPFYFSMNAMGKEGDFAHEYLKKGSVVFASFSRPPFVNTYTGNDGQTRINFVITVDRIMGLKKSAENPEDNIGEDGLPMY